MNGRDPRRGRRREGECECGGPKPLTLSDDQDFPLLFVAVKFF